MARTQARNGKDTDTNLADVSAQIEQIKADIAALTDTLGDTASAATQKGIEAAKSAGEDARARAELVGEQAVATARANPGVTLGIAAGVGFLAGFLLTKGR